MRWIVLALLAVMAVTLHTTIGPRLAVGGIRPDAVLVLGTFFALYLRAPDALVAAWALGLLADLESVERFGLLSLSYLAAAGAVFLLREAVFRQHPLTQFVMTLLAGVVFHATVTLYYTCTGGLGTVPAWSLLGRGVLVGLYSAAWAPLVHGALLKFGPQVGLGSPKRDLATPTA
jgi:rod shape-determining protein MreD